MKLLINCHSHADYDGFDYAFQVITPELAALILKRRDLFNRIRLEDPSLAYMEYGDGGPMYIANIPEAVDAEEPPFGESFRILAADTPVEPFDAIAQRSECDRMVLTPQDVYWACYPKHGDVEVETHPIDYATIERAAKEDL